MADRGGLFRPHSLTWRVNSEAVLLLGGGRALLLQVAHPKVAAGVAEHSAYREDPWGRLYRTLDTTLRIVFGDPGTSAAASARLRRIHSRVRGVDDRGDSYSALDPELLLWVHATLIDTSLLIYGRYVAELKPLERALYYEEMKRLGRAYGIPDGGMPEDYPAFRRYWERMLADGLRVTEAARDVADSVLRPPLPLAARPAAVALNLVTVGTLPERLRDELGLGWGPARERLLAASQAAIRRLVPALPRLLRAFPPAREAERRAAG